jgi:predicted transcriptional regulator
MINKKILIPAIKKFIRENGAQRVTDIESKFYLNRQAARRLLNQMVKEGKLQVTKIHYVGNADLCIYKVK